MRKLVVFARGDIQAMVRDGYEKPPPQLIPRTQVKLNCSRWGSQMNPDTISIEIASLRASFDSALQAYAHFIPGGLHPNN